MVDGVSRNGGTDWNFEGLGHDENGGVGTDKKGDLAFAQIVKQHLEALIKLEGGDREAMLEKLKALEKLLLTGNEEVRDKKSDDIDDIRRQLNVPADTVSADIYAFMALFQKLAQQMRNSNREIRTSELQGQVSELLNAAQEMRNAANQRLVAAIVQGASQIAGGAFQIGMSSASLKSTVQSAKLEHQAANAGSLRQGLEKTPENAELRGDLRQMQADFARDAKIAGARGSMQQGVAQGGSQVFSGVGSIIAAGFNRAADEADARRSEADARAKVHETNVQHANDMMQQMMEVIRDVRDKLSSINQAAIETNRGIARNI